MVTFAISPPFLGYKFVCDVIFTSGVFIEIIVLWSDLTRFPVYIYMWYIFLVCKSVQMTILIIIPFLQRDIIFLFPWSLARKTCDINKIIYGASLLVVSYWAFYALIFWYFDLHCSPQRINSVVWFPRYISYSTHWAT